MRGHSTNHLNERNGKVSNEGEGKREQGGQGNGQGRNQTTDGRGREEDEGDAADPAEARGPQAATPQAGTIQDRLAALESERDEIKDRMLRIAAEFENWKKRARKEQEEAEAKARESVLRDMLDVMDNLERAMGASGQAGDKTGAKPGLGSDAQAVLKGVELVLRLFQSKLERYGVKPIAAVGQPFDPHLHEAISRVETADVPAGHVAVEMQRGYRIGDRLLRPSLVGVAVAPARTTGAGGPGGGSPPKAGSGFDSGNGIGEDGA
jgi:molecular chaperone GrpE